MMPNEISPIDYECYDWTALIDDVAREEMVVDVDHLIAQGHYWKNSPPYQTDVNIFALGNNWNNLKMSFIWSCFAYMKQERQIKTIKSWGYKTNVDTQEDRSNYWHQHLREGSVVLSGVYYLHIPKGVDMTTSGTEFAPYGPENEGHFFVPAQVGHWAIWPGKAWHRPGVLTSEEFRYIIAADMEF
jgi:hypothetical protein